MIDVRDEAEKLASWIMNDEDLANRQSLINVIEAVFTRVSAASTGPVVDDLKLNNDEIGELINYNLRKLSEAPCKESARVFRTRVERLRAIYEN